MPNAQRSSRLSDPAIDVLMPSYQYGRYISDAVHSLERQSGWTGRLVVQDGQSTDGTVEYLESLGSSFVSWRSEPDHGQSDALNKALDRSSAPWVGWLNADEFYLPATMERVQKQIRGPARGADVIYGDYAQVDAEGDFLRLVPAHRFDDRALRRYGVFLPSCAAFIRRDALVTTRWRTQFRRVMDWDLWLRLQQSGAKFFYTGEVYGCFRVHKDQVTALPRKLHEREFGLLRSEFDGLAGPDAPLPSRAAARGMHVVLKALDGGYGRQVLSRRRARGKNLRWWAGDSEEDIIRRAFGY